MGARGSEPRVRVAAVLLVDGRLVVVSQRRHGAPYYLLPGGGVRLGEPLGEALAREVAEETGLLCEVDRPLFLNDSIAPDGSRHLVNATFLARITGGSVTRTSDYAVVDVHLVERRDLAGIDLRPPIAEALAQAWDAGFSGQAEYLGALWTEEPS